MVQETNGYADLGDGKLHFEQIGEGEPLVLIHAGITDSRMWDGQWAAFARDYRVIRFDMRGFGKSDRMEAPRNRRDDLYRLLQHLEIERAALVGCSLGGEIILDFALEHPRKVSALVAVSTVPSGFELQGEPPPYLLEMIAAAQQGDLALASELQNRIWVDGPFREPEQVDSRVRERVAEMSLLALANRTMQVDMAPPANPLVPPAMHRLKEIAAPTLIVAGRLDHPEILRAAAAMASDIPEAQTVILPDAAHLPNMEQPEAFNETVLAFLGKQIQAA